MMLGSVERISVSLFPTVYRTVCAAAAGGFRKCEKLTKPSSKSLCERAKKTGEEMALKDGRSGRLLWPPLCEGCPGPGS